MKCVNATRAPAAPIAYPAPVLAAGPAPCNALAAPGGAADVAGLWLNAAKDQAVLNAGDEWAVLSFPRGEELEVMRGVTLAHECLAPGEVASASAYQAVWANGTGADGYSCRVKERTGADAYTTRAGAGATDGFTSSSWEAVPGAEVAVPEGTPTCDAAAPAAAVPAAAPASAAPTLPCALAAAAAAAALLACA
jgi:hypothetical protein